MIEEDKEKDEENPEDKLSDHDKIRENLQDRQFTEDLVQNFIMEVSSVILLVVSDLTFEDQKLISKIKDKFKNEKKSLIIVHNLIFATEIEAVINNIENQILLSFSLDEMPFPDYKHGIKENENKNQFTSYYIENGDIEVIHFIIAKHGSPAGDYFNPPVLKQIETMINSTKPQKFNLVDLFKVYIDKSLPKYVTNELGNSKTELKDSKLSLSEKVNFNFHSLNADEIGLIKIFSNAYKPEHMVYSNKDYLVVRYYLPAELEELKQAELIIKDGFFNVIVKGNFKIEQPENAKMVINTLKVNHFEFITESKKLEWNLDTSPELGKSKENNKYFIKFKIKPIPIEKFNIKDMKLEDD